MPRFKLVLVLVSAFSAGLFAYSDSPKEQREVRNSVGMKFRSIPAGTFTMGAPKEEGRGNDPQHQVDLTQEFLIGTHPVTQAEYEKVIGSNPSGFSKKGLGRFRVDAIDTTRFPVENVSWAEAVAFCKALSALDAEKKAGRSYRLPTEAEWEYACRAGAQTSYTFGKGLSSDQANFNGNYPGGDGAKGTYLQRPCPVGSYKANAWGLYDVHGNVWQWCSDWYDEGYYTVSPRKNPTGPSEGKKRVLRGGSWLNRGQECRASDRLALEPDEKYHNVGFRIVCEETGKAKP